MGKLTYRDYLAWEQLPHLWCSGCGHGVILKALLLALAELEIPPARALLATGIGCVGRAGDYVSFHRFQGTHGRTLAFVTGMKLVRPDLEIVCLMGDGDAGAIGGNHLVHAARRNLGVTAIVANNFNYGMTGGQFSPLTPPGSITSTSRAGKKEPLLDLSKLVAAAGAGYVARTTVYHVTELQNFLREALSYQGFSFVEVFTPCPTYFGRYNQWESAPAMLAWFREKVIPLRRYQELEPEAKAGYFWRGCLRKGRFGGRLD